MKKITLIILTFIISTLCMTSCSAAEPQNVSASDFTLTMKIGEPVDSKRYKKRNWSRTHHYAGYNQRKNIGTDTCFNRRNGRSYSLGRRYAECYNRSRQRYNNTYNRQHNCICKWGSKNTWYRARYNKWPNNAANPVYIWKLGI